MHTNRLKIDLENCLSRIFTEYAKACRIIQGIKEDEDSEELDCMIGDFDVYGSFALDIEYGLIASYMNDIIVLADKQKNKELMEILFNLGLIDP